MPLCVQSPDGSLLIAVKAVPGASRDEVAGVLGERLKVRVSTPPEGGKANQAICATLAAALGRRPREVAVVAGAASPEKTIRVEAMHVEEAARLLGFP